MESGKGDRTGWWYLWSCAGGGAVGFPSAALTSGLICSANIQHKGELPPTKTCPVGLCCVEGCTPSQRGVGLSSPSPAFLHPELICSFVQA